MNGVFIPFHGIYIDVFDLRWQMLSDAYNIILLNDFNEKTAYLMRSYKKI